MKVAQQWARRWRAAVQLGTRGSICAEAFNEGLKELSLIGKPIFAREKRGRHCIKSNGPAYLALLAGVAKILIQCGLNTDGRPRAQAEDEVIGSSREAI